MELIKIQLIDTILKYQSGDNDSILCILDKFKFNIKKISNKLGYEYAETDLTIHLIEVIKNIDIQKFNNKSDGAIVNYINTSFKNKATHLYKWNLKLEHEITEFNDDIKSDYDLQTNTVELYSLLSCLNETQQKIIIYKYINDLSYIEISSTLGISRQSVYSNKIKALAKLKKSL